MGSVTLSSNTDITFQISYVLQIHASNTRVTYSLQGGVLLLQTALLQMSRAASW